VTAANPISSGHPLAILGAGVMGETVLSGLLRAGWHADQIVATDRRPERREELIARYGIRMLENTDAVAEAETVILVVKPQDMRELLAEIAESIRPGALGGVARGRSRHCPDRIPFTGRSCRGAGDAEYAGPGR
jgi:predicted dehydrogenase